MAELVDELRVFIVECLDLDDVTPSEIDPDAPLFGEGLGLDSIDALELGLGLFKKYRVKLDPSDDATRGHFLSVRTLAAYVAANRDTAEAE